MAHRQRRAALTAAETAQLVERAAAGDEASFTALVQSFTPLVWTVARSFHLGHADADDVVQATWFRMAEHLGRIREPSRLSAWLVTTAKHECFSLLRKAGRATPSEIAEDAVAEVIDLTDAMFAGERSKALWTALEAMPPRCRQLLRLLAHDPPLSYDDISDLTGLPHGSIGPTRQRCLDRLRARPEIARLSSDQLDPLDAGAIDEGTSS
jgi:RNA polymerase sigma factor (sigma-70 family)